MAWPKTAITSAARATAIAGIQGDGAGTGLQGKVDDPWSDAAGWEERRPLRGWPGDGLGVWESSMDSGWIEKKKFKFRWSNLYALGRLQIYKRILPRYSWKTCLDEITKKPESSPGAP